VISRLLKEYETHDIVITTSRPANENDQVERFLKDVGLDDVIQDIYNTRGSKASALLDSGALAHYDDRTSNLNLILDAIDGIDTFLVNTNSEKISPYY